MGCENSYWPALWFRLREYHNFGISCCCYYYRIITDWTLLRILWLGENSGHTYSPQHLIKPDCFYQIDIIPLLMPLYMFSLVLSLKSDQVTTCSGCLIKDWINIMSSWEAKHYELGECNLLYSWWGMIQNVYAIMLVTSSLFSACYISLHSNSFLSAVTTFDFLRYTQF